MADEFSAVSHTTFFDGYLDAVGRHYTDDKWLCAITAAVTPSRILNRLSIISSTPVVDMVKEFERDIVQFLDADPRNRLIFYLVEYFAWYQQFSKVCECESVRFAGIAFPHEHIGYRLLIDQTHEVLFLAYWKDKNAVVEAGSQPSGVHDEDSAWLRHLKALGQTQGFLTYAQVNEKLPLAIVDPEEIDAIVERLKHLGIRIVPE